MHLTLRFDIQEIQTEVDPTVAHYLVINRCHHLQSCRLFRLHACPTRNSSEITWDTIHFRPALRAPPITMRRRRAAGHQQSQSTTISGYLACQRNSRAIQLSTLTVPTKAVSQSSTTTAAVTQSLVSSSQRPRPACHPEALPVRSITRRRRRHFLRALSTSHSHLVSTNPSTTGPALRGRQTCPFRPAIRQWRFIPSA